MDSFKKYGVLLGWVALSLLLIRGALADSQNVLLVHLVYDSDQKTFALISAEQKVFEGTDAAEAVRAGRYTLLLYNGQQGGDTSASFNLPEGTGFEGIGKDGTPLAGVMPRMRNITVPLVLKQPIHLDIDTLELKDKQLQKGQGILIKEKGIRTLL